VVAGPPVSGGGETVLVVGPRQAGVSAVAAALRRHVPQGAVAEATDGTAEATDGTAEATDGTAEAAAVVVFVVSAAAHLTGSDCAVLDSAAQNTDAVICVVSKSDVHRGWREVIAANRGVLASLAPRYARVPWVGVAAQPELGEPDVDDLVRAVRAQLADPGLARRNKLRASASRLRETARRLDADVDDADRRVRVDALRERRAAALRDRRRETAERSAALRSRIQQARVQLSFLARNRCAAARAELQEHAAGLSRRRIPAFEGLVRTRLAEVVAEIGEAVDARLATLADEVAGKAAGEVGVAVPAWVPTREQPPAVPVPPPPLASRRQEAWLMTILGAGFGVGLALTLSRLVGGVVSRLAPGLALAAAAACVVTGLVVTVMVVRIRAVLHDRALLDRWVGEAAASLRSVVEEQVATRVLAAETAHGAALLARDEAAQAQVSALLSAIDGELREHTAAAARAAAARQRQMPAILAALDALRAELPAAAM